MDRQRSTVLEQPSEQRAGRVTTARAERLDVGRRERADQGRTGRHRSVRALHGLLWDTVEARAELVVAALEEQGHGIHRVGDESRLEACVDRDGVDVAIIACSDLEAVPPQLWEHTHVPVICYGGLTDAADRVRYLDRGADDVVPAPLSLEELEARVRSVLWRTRRQVEPANAPMVCGDLTLDAATSRVRVRGHWVDLTTLECKLLEFLMRHPAQTFSRGELLERVWGFTVGDTSTVSVHIRRLRLKLEEHPARPAIIKTVWGVGYYLEPHAR